MKIAAVTITYNDDYKIKEWYRHYLEYKDELFIHIIVDNCSDYKYLKALKKTFTDSCIIERTSNGGCTGAYNDGIEYALSIPEVDAVMLIGNDIELKSGAVRILYETLFSDSKLGMVSPILLYKDSKINSDFGCDISKMLIMQPYCDGINIDEIDENIHYCEAVTGGANMAKRVFYESVGLQDNNLFMYSDEVDMGIRGKRNGFTMAAIKHAVARHQHINLDITNDQRQPFTKYLGARNKVYLARKHFGMKRAFIVFIVFLLGGFYKIMYNVIRGRFANIRAYLWWSLGAVMGLIGNMKHNRFSLPKEDTVTKKLINEDIQYDRKE